MSEDESARVGQVVDVAAARELIAALERDLEKVSGDTSDLQRLRGEVASLKNALKSPDHEPHSVSASLHGIRGLLKDAVDETVAESVKGGLYIAEIGRILGF